jgi:hypothetical protein
VDALDIVVLALRLTLVLLLYLFLWTVLRAGWRSLTSAGPARDREAEPGPALGLQVEEPGASGLAPGQIIEVPDGATVGRGATAQVRVADPTVSASHARLARLGRRWLVDDLGSTNGTSVNEEPVQDPMEIGPGDVLALGSVKLRVVRATD